MASAAAHRFLRRRARLNRKPAFIAAGVRAGLGPGPGVAGAIVAGAIVAAAGWAIAPRLLPAADPARRGRRTAAEALEVEASGGLR